MTRLLPILLMAFLSLAPSAQAAYQSCAGRAVDPDTSRCPDGSIPTYNPGAPPVKAEPPAKPAALDKDGKPNLFGIWHTTAPGAAYEKPVDVPGSSTLGIKPGLAPGDLTISSNGSYVWNTYTGTSGRWLKADGDMPILLLDDALGKRWKVGPAEGGGLKVTDGKIVRFGRR